jgi:hypothetical protein
LKVGVQPSACPVVRPSAVVRTTGQAEV